jgi:hypothetical protein
MNEVVPPSDIATSCTTVVRAGPRPMYPFEVRNMQRPDVALATETSTSITAGIFMTWFNLRASSCLDLKITQRLFKIQTKKAKVSEDRVRRIMVRKVSRNVDCRRHPDMRAAEGISLLEVFSKKPRKRFHP